MNSELEHALVQFDVPLGSEHCGDLMLLRAIKARLFCMYQEPDSPFYSLGLQLKEWLRSTEGLQRIRQGIKDTYSHLRGHCGRLLIAMKEPEADSIAMQLLSDPEWDVRAIICEALRQTPLPSCEDRLIELAKEDPSFEVRGQAALALARYSPVKVIPVLLQMMESDHETDSDPDVQTAPPSAAAATALDKLLDTSWVSTRLPGGFATFPPGPVDLESLREQAKLELDRLRRRVE
jgi:hypothetical protein